MNFSCKRSDLIHGVQTVLNAVSPRNTLPILSNILLEAESGILRLTTTDLEVSIKCIVPADISEPGSITIPAKRLSEIVRELPDSDITITVNDNSMVTLVCEKSLFKINGLPPDDFPVLPKVKNEKGLNLSKTSVLDMIKKTIFSVSNDETRYVLNGVLFTVEDDVIRMVSTDGHRLSMIEQHLEKNPTQKINYIVPSKALQELGKILSAEGEINIQINDNQIIFSDEEAVLMSRLIDGQFPNYSQVIPKQSDKSVTCNTDLLLSATRRVALMASDKSSSVKYTISNNKLVITANTPEVGEAQEEMDISYSGDNISIAFNAKYVMDVLKNISSEECYLGLTTSLNPGVFKPVSEDQQYFCIVMPMRI
ncbi:DNA polymerase III subunit beta [candidate division FCPU426 bacterium]|nr:DNA polymerase III subunit beta [candidate division FCPU426 bacterium]